MAGVEKDEAESIQAMIRSAQEAAAKKPEEKTPESKTPQAAAIVYLDPCQPITGFSRIFMELGYVLSSGKV